MTARVARCPHCATTFKVVADQLRLRAGWVRCGVCGQVFDARDPQEAPPVVVPTSVEPALPAAELPAIFHVPEQRARREPASGPHEPFFDIPSDDADDFEHPSDLRGYGRSGTGYGAAAAGLPPVLRRGPQSAVARACWSAALLIALLALLGQALWWWRTPIATYAPVMRPVLESACAALGCTVGYVRKPQQLSIESSSVQPRTGQGGALSQDAGQPLVLSALLRNRASHPQPWPALELSLTDYSDTVVMRRALMPGDYLRPDVAARPFAAHSEQHVTVEFMAQGVPVSGYRIAPFFP